MVRIHPRFEAAHAGLQVGRFEGGTLSELGEKDTLLLSILALAVGVAGFPEARPTQKNKFWQKSSMTKILAGSGVIFEISGVT